MSDWREIAEEFGAEFCTLGMNTAGIVKVVRNMAEEIVRLRFNHKSAMDAKEHYRSQLTTERAYSEKLKEYLIAIDGCTFIPCLSCSEQLQLALDLKRPGE